MPDKSSPGLVEDFKVHLPFDPQTEVAQKARFFNSVDAFNLALNPVPDKVFQNEVEQVMESGSTTGYVACDSLLEEDPVVPAFCGFLLAQELPFSHLGRDRAPDYVHSLCASARGRTPQVSPLG